MWKVLIADDEPKIRRGLRNSVYWNELDMEVVGEAEDGEVALAMAKKLQPDILLVDICMPFLSGLQLIERINSILTGCIIIVVTGHDEFSYAQQALKLRVFDYILKPVSREQLRSVLDKAREELMNCSARNKYLKWASTQLKRNLPFIRELFMNGWVNGHKTDKEIHEQINFLGLTFDENSGMLVVKVLERLSKDELLKEWDHHLLLFAAQNIVEELLEQWQPNVVFRDNKDNIVAITPVKQASEWMGLEMLIQAAVEKYLKQVAIVCQMEIDGGILNAPRVYENLMTEINERGSCSPVVLLAKKYIETNYYREDLTLEDVAQNVQISPTYLSRLLKQEIGATFIDYLTQVRVKRATQLMNDPAVKVYEVAKSVGYNSQHYFSTAFKKVLGISPVEYRKGGKGNG